MSLFNSSTEVENKVLSEMENIKKVVEQITEKTPAEQEAHDKIMAIAKAMGITKDDAK
ncbi:hypothetical protein N9V42_02085 [Flavobacteriaceae bacterium]|nr:hypothetical protein [Flavobacteriaceae bacterium]